MVAWAVQATVRAVGAGRAGLVAQRGGETRGAGTDPAQGITGGPMVAVTAVLAVLAPRVLITLCMGENTAVSQGPALVTSSPSPPPSRAPLPPSPSPSPSPTPSIPIPIAVPIPSPTPTPSPSHLFTFPCSPPGHLTAASLSLSPSLTPTPSPSPSHLILFPFPVHPQNISHRRPLQNPTPSPNPGVPVPPPHSLLEQSCPLQPGSHWQRSGATHRPWTHSWVQRAAGTQLGGEQRTAQEPPPPLAPHPSHSRTQASLFS